MYSGSLHQQLETKPSKEACYFMMQSVYLCLCCGSETSKVMVQQFMITNSFLWVCDICSILLYFLECSIVELLVVPCAFFAQFNLLIFSFFCRVGLLDVILSIHFIINIFPFSFTSDSFAENSSWDWKLWSFKVLEHQFMSPTMTPQRNVLWF